jgi:alpha-tubulin suppressor-like RCC1 family protein
MSSLRSCSVLVLLAAALASCDTDDTPPGASEPIDTPAEPTLDVSAIAIGESGSPCLLFGDGAIHCWGTFAQGISAEVANGQPALVQESGAVALALGARHGCALLAEGTVACWGDNSLAQLGNGPGEASPLPRLVQGIEDAVAIAAAEETTCVVTQRATAECWGGMLEQFLPQPGPTELPGLQGVVDVALGSLRTEVYALTSDGQVYTWGEPIGTGSGVAELQAGPVIPGAVELDAGSFHLCARTDTGQVLCWGRSNSYGALGRSPSFERSAEPLLIDDWSDVVALGAGQDHNCVVRADGSVWCWGKSILDDGDLQFDISPLPFQIRGVSSARSLSRGGDGSCAILADTSAVCWGAVGISTVAVPGPITDRLVDRSP